LRVRSWAIGYIYRDEPSRARGISSWRRFCARGEDSALSMDSNKEQSPPRAVARGLALIRSRLGLCLVSRACSAPMVSLGSPCLPFWQVPWGILRLCVRRCSHRLQPVSRSNADCDARHLPLAGTAITPLAVELTEPVLALFVSPTTDHFELVSHSWSCGSFSVDPDTSELLDTFRIPPNAGVGKARRPVWALLHPMWLRSQRVVFLGPVA
jgi:hypothetical protein